MSVYVVRVRHTDRSRAADGRFTEFSTVVKVDASDDIDALLAAEQMVMAIRDNNGHVLGSRILAVTL